MKAGQTMTDEELQDAAREAIEGHTQAEVAEALGVGPSTISQALSRPVETRYAGTLRRIVEHYTDFRVMTEKVHRVEKA